MSFPRIALHDAADLAAVLEPVRAAAVARLERAPLDAGARQAGRSAIEAWLQVAQRHLQDNVALNGMTWAEAAAHKTPVAPFDAVLSAHVQALHARADALTAQAIARRKEVPARRAAALQARHEALRRAREASDVRKRKREEEWKAAPLPPPPAPPARLAETAATLRKSLAELEALQTELPKLTERTRTHTALVKRLRSGA